MSLHRILCLALLLVAASPRTDAHANLITNGDFNIGTFTGWTATGNIEVYHACYVSTRWSSIGTGNRRAEATPLESLGMLGCEEERHDEVVPPGGLVEGETDVPVHARGAGGGAPDASIR